MTYRRGRLALAGRIGGRFGFGTGFLDCRCFLGGRSLGCFLRRTDFLLGSSIFGDGILFSRRLLGDCQCTKSKQSKACYLRCGWLLGYVSILLCCWFFLGNLDGTRRTWKEHQHGKAIVAMK